MTAEIQSSAPSSMKGVFVDNAAILNKAGGYWMGCIPVKQLVDSQDVEQVKAGAKGKHGVINPISGDYQQDTEAIYVWKRKNGRLEVISGRHKYDLALRTNTAAVTCYVYPEDAQHDANWARLLDFENNMRGDQADELTAAIYTRETGYSDQELRNRGLMRNKSKSKRGILIGREAREELWTRFKNDVISPMDAEIIVKMTMNIRNAERIEDIQAKCVDLLEQKKSWDYISAMVQLMASKESVFMQQGLLDLGADFEADMQKAATYIEKNVQGLTEAIGIIKSGRKLSGKKKELASRLGQHTTTQEESTQILEDLTLMKEMFGSVGAYPELVAAAQMWDGETKLDPVGYALDYARKTRERVEGEKDLSREEWEKAQVDYSGMGELSFSTRHTLEELGLNSSDIVTPPYQAFTREDATKTLKEERTRVNDKGGVYAKGLDRPFFITRATIGKMPSGAALQDTRSHIADKDDNYYKMHFLAAANAAYLWEKSTHIEKHPDKYEDSNVQEVYRQKAHMIYEDKLYQVKLTGFTYEKGKGKDHLYTIQIEDVIEIQKNELGEKYSATHSKEQAQLTNQAQEENSTSTEDVKPTFSTRLAPNGKPSNLTEKQWHQVRTPEFKAWFGDWENDPESASKAVDKNGEPLVVYHGTSTVFTEFKHGISKKGLNLLGEGFYFTSDKEDAEGYAHRRSGGESEGNVIGAFLNTRTPLILSERTKASEDKKKSLESTHHDGVIKPLISESILYMVFDSTQIKSATDNRGTFDASNPDITFSIAGSRAVGFDKAKAEGRTYIDQKDGKEKFFLDVSNAKIKDDLNLEYIKDKGRTDKYMQLDDVLDFPELYDAYPHLRKIKIDIYSFSKFVDGNFIPELSPFGVTKKSQWGYHSISINTNEELFTNRDSLLSIIIHEVQHVIQAYEGFSSGFSSTPTYEQALAYLREAIRQRRPKARANAKQKANYEALVASEKELRENPSALLSTEWNNGGISKYLYNMSAGEMEARFAEERLPHNVFLWSDLDSYALFPGSVSVVDSRLEGRKPDITFSTRNLITAHSLDASRLKDAAKLGGMPLPSVAVTRVDAPYSWATHDTGVMLIAGQELADPELGNEVFSAGAWAKVTPTYYPKRPN